MNIALSAVGAGFARKNYDFLFSPVHEPRHHGHREALEATRFGLSHVPGANFLL